MQLISVCLPCILWPCQTHLLVLVVLLWFFSIDSLGFSMWTIMSSANADNFISSFLLCRLFISFVFLPIALARISSTVLNKSGERGHPYLNPSLRGGTFSLSPLSIILAIDFFCRYPLSC